MYLYLSLSLSLYIYIYIYIHTIYVCICMVERLREQRGPGMQARGVLPRQRHIYTHIYHHFHFIIIFIIIIIIINMYIYIYTHVIIIYELAGSKVRLLQSLVKTWSEELSVKILNKSGIGQCLARGRAMSVHVRAHVHSRGPQG